LQVWTHIANFKKQFSNLDEQLQIIDAIERNDFAQCQEIVNDIKKHEWEGGEAALLRR